MFKLYIIASLYILLLERFTLILFRAIVWILKIKSVFLILIMINWH